MIPHHYHIENRYVSVAREVVSGVVPADLPVEMVSQCDHVEDGHGAVARHLAGDGRGVADVPDSIAVGVRLVRIRVGRAVVHVAAGAVPVRVVVRVEQARVTGVPDAVTVGSPLRGIEGAGAVIDVSAYSVVVRIVPKICRFCAGGGVRRKRQQS